VCENNINNVIIIILMIIIINENDNINDINEILLMKY